MFIIACVTNILIEWHLIGVFEISSQLNFVSIFIVQLIITEELG